MINKNTERALHIIQLFCFIFWIVTKIWFDIAFFNAIYELSWLVMILFPIVTSLVFLYLWIRDKCKFFTPYYYGLFFGISICIIMRCVDRIDIISLH